MRHFFHSKTGHIALGSILSAGSLAILWMACLFPTGKPGITAVAGLFPMIGVLAAGRSVGYLCWAAAAVLAFLLLPDKGVALLFALFLGVYPVVKERMEAIRSLPLEWVLKLFYFNLAFTLFLYVFSQLFLPMLPKWPGGILYGAGNAVFVCYDIGLTRLIGLLRARLRLH